MPLYEYLCEDCGRRSEVLQRLDEPPITTCPHCGGAVRKLLSAPAFQFKGSGWYLTDYARKGAASGESASPSSSSSSSNTESKSAESASPKSGDGGASTSPAKESKPAPSGGGDKAT